MLKIVIFLNCGLQNTYKVVENTIFGFPVKKYTKKKNYPNCVKIEQVMRFYVLQDGF